MIKLYHFDHCSEIFDKTYLSPHQFTNLLIVSICRNPNKYSNGSWMPVYWPLHTARNKEYLELSTNNMTQGKGHRSRKCAFWNSYLPSLIGKEHIIVYI